MKLFVAVITFAVVPFVFAADVTWQVAPPFSLMPGGSGQESGQTTKVQMPHEAKEKTAPKDDHEYPKLAPLNTNQKAAPDQRSGHDGEGDVNPHEKPREWSDAVIIGIIIGVGSLFFGYRQVFYAKKADRREEQSAKDAEKSTLVEQKKGRAYITVGRWQMKNEWKGGPYILTCDLHNTGQTPATLGEYDIHTDLRKDSPPLLKYEELPRTDLKGIVLGAGGRHTLQAPDPIRQFARQVVEGILDPVFTAMKLSLRRREEILTAAQRSTPMPMEEFDRVLDTRAVTLYVYGCIAYADEFDSPHRVAFCTWYDPKQEIFLLLTDREYNYST